MLVQLMVEYPQGIEGVDGSMSYERLLSDVMAGSQDGDKAVIQSRLWSEVVGMVVEGSYFLRTITAIMMSWGLLK